MAIYEFFPGNYRWSYNTLLGFAAGGQFGDIALILPKLTAAIGDDRAWHREWTWLATVLERRAEGQASDLTKSENLFLASLYHTLAEHFINPTDPARLEAYHHVLACFERARQAAPFPLERVLVPYDGTTLPAYFLRADGAGRACPTVIFICGLDTTKELWFLRARLHFAARGMNCLFIDTPGIGEALRLQKLYTMSDYERPVGAAIDYLGGRDDVDADRIGLVGSSLGGYYVARAAAYEPRLKATAAWGAIYDYHRVWQRRMESGSMGAAPIFQLMFITGTTTMEAAIARIADFKIAPFAARIAKPFLIMHGADDIQVPMADAHAMFDAIAAPDKEMAVFSGENGGTAHTQFDNHLPALQFVGDWMKRKLQ
jgi:dienelactone hydrolase